MSQRRLDYLRSIRVRLNKQSEDCLNLNIYVPHNSAKGNEKGIEYPNRRQFPLYQNNLCRPFQATSDAVCTRRVLQLGCRQPLRRTGSGQLRGGGGGHRQLQAWRPRFPQHQHCASPAPADGQLRPDGSNCGAQVGPAEHRTLWRRP